MRDDRREDSDEEQETPEPTPESRGGRPQQDVERAVVAPPETR